MIEQIKIDPDLEISGYYLSTGRRYSGINPTTSGQFRLILRVFAPKKMRARRDQDTIKRIDNELDTRSYATVQVIVRDNNVDQALKALKKKMQREGIFREMKLRGHYEKPSEKRAREKAEAIRRARKLARKKAQREGLIPGSHS